MILPFASIFHWFVVEFILSVNSWDGGRSHVDQEVDKDRRSEKRRHWSDDYEEELDRGKVRITSNITTYTLRDYFST